MKNNIVRTAAVIISFMLIVIASGCGNSSKDSAEPVTLENKMTDTERARVEKRSLTLLDEPDGTIIPEAYKDKADHTVSIEFRTYTADDLLASTEEAKEYMSDEDYAQAMEYIGRMRESGEVVSSMAYVLVDGKLLTQLVPSADYDGGEFSFTQTETPPDGEPVTKDVVCADFEEYLEWIRRDCIDRQGYSGQKADFEVRRVKTAYEAVKSGDYKTLPEGTVDPNDETLYDGGTDYGKDYRDKWEYDREAVEAIKDSIDEISIYDEELDTEFLVHVTLPPDYDRDKKYPVFFLTDGVWRFGNHAELRKVMERGEAGDVILVSLGYEYYIDGTDEANRFEYLVRKRDMLLDFITDNLMPYLGENYNIDYANSTLYGHSDGGVFAHSALFRSDLYGNQPFGRYIIGSPAFWSLYSGNYDLDPDGCENDYGYFDRNEKLDKYVFLCGGSLEDPDYADMYNGHATTLQGLEELNERLKTHGVDVTYKLYESHHYQFIPEMLVEYLKTAYN